MGLTKNALAVLKSRYLKKNEKGKVIESPRQMFLRVANNIALADKKYNKNWKKTSREFYQMMIGFDFLPNSPTLFNAGRKLQQLSACFVLPIEDNIDQISITDKSSLKV